MTLNNIFFEYSIDTSLNSSNISTPFSIPGVGTSQVSGDFSYTYNYGLIGYKFDNNSFLDSVNITKINDENNLKNISGLGDLQSRSDTNKITFSTKFGNISYAENELNSFTNSVTNDSVFSYAIKRSFRYYFGNKIYLYFDLRLNLSSDDAHSIQSNNSLVKVNEDNKGIVFAGLNYTKNFNTVNAYDITDSIDFKIAGELGLDNDLFISGGYTYNLANLKDSNATAEGVSGFKTIVGKTEKDKIIYYDDIDTWELGWQ
jgi:hypothetical protein